MTSDRSEPSARKAMTRDEIRDQWALVAGDWARWEPYLASSFWPVRQRLMTQARLRPGMRVLDIGCGIGDLGLPIASAVAAGGSVLGIDLARDTTEGAQSLERYALDIGKYGTDVQAASRANEMLMDFYKSLMSGMMNFGPSFTGGDVRFG